MQEESESKQAEFKERIQTLNKQKQDQVLGLGRILFWPDTGYPADL